MNDKQALGFIPLVVCLLLVCGCEKGDGNRTIKKAAGDSATSGALKDLLEGQAEPNDSPLPEGKPATGAVAPKDESSVESDSGETSSSKDSSAEPVASKDAEPKSNVDATKVESSSSSSSESQPTTEDSKNVEAQAKDMESDADSPEESVEEGVSEDKNDEVKDSAVAKPGSSIVPPSRAYLPPNRNTAPPPPLPAPKSERELAEERKIREAAKKRGELTFDDLVFDMEKDELFEESMLRQENWDLHEKTWKIRGFILPTTLFSQTGITEFVLVRDNQECCFGPGAALYDCVIVTMEPGKSISYTTRVVTVKGKLEIDTESFKYPDDEGHYAVYKMTAEEVK